ncbi:MAG: nicotinate-nucleotide--dimethylbenzimidazole phosphoribosyltransferase, partial [Nitrospirae bacterium]|nr:nicotinate-nucleotide--dimethylbenzimidazole phosphoribosyltransferase [Nitrospirota bacterium]
MTSPSVTEKVASDSLIADGLQARLDRLTKPLGSLGRLEELARWYGAARGTAAPVLRRKTVAVFAGDHGVTAEGVSAYPSDVTAQMVYNFLRGGAGINVLARHAGAEVVVVDVGVAHAFPEMEGLRRCKVRPGTANLAVGPAMTREDTEAAMAVGMAVAEELAASGVDVIGLGEMGIGNTTPSSAITAVMVGADPRVVTGRGTGLDEAAWAHKVSVIERALAVNQPDPNDPLEVLTALGGLEIAALVGAMFGAARCRVPVVLDGFISGAAALIAVGLEPSLRGYLLAAHRSVEPGHGLALDRLGLAPL